MTNNSDENVISPDSLDLAQLKDLKAKMESALPDVIRRFKEKSVISIDDYEGKIVDPDKQRFVLRAGSYGEKCPSCNLSKFKRNPPVAPGDVVSVFNRDGLVVISGYGDNGTHYAISVAMNLVSMLESMQISTSLSVKISDEVRMNKITTLREGRTIIREFPEFGVDVIVQKVKQ